VALFRHVKYNAEVTRGLDILAMLLSPAHTRYYHHHHMEAPNTDAANTLLKRPRLAQCSAYAVWCSNTPVPCTTLIPEAFPHVYCISQQRRHYTGYVSSRYCQAGRSPHRAPHGLYTTTPAAVTAGMYCCTLQYALPHKLHSPSTINVHN
jgi:hypothetical protein